MFAVVILRIKKTLFRAVKSKENSNIRSISWNNGPNPKKRPSCNTVRLSSASQIPIYRSIFHPFILSPGINISWSPSETRSLSPESIPFTASDSAWIGTLNPFATSSAVRVSRFGSTIQVLPPLKKEVASDLR